MRKGEQALIAQTLRGVLRSQTALGSMDAASIRSARRLLRRLRGDPATYLNLKPLPDCGKQASLYYSFVPKPRGRRQRYSAGCRYPMVMVEDARLMRDNGYTYKEIAAALTALHKISVQWGTVRDWTVGRSRQLG